MNIGIMQPYLFPYIGYFQLIAHCDVFVLLDDVQYILRGWINRNRILVNSQPAWITIPVRAAPHTLAINQRHYVLENGALEKIIRRVAAAYHRAPQRDQVLAAVARILEWGDTNVGDFNAKTIGLIADYLGIGTPILRSSQLTALDGLQGIQRIIAICRTLGATAYVNPIGGASLYPREEFAAAGLDLFFLQPAATPYRQFNHEFVPSLSIIDVLMHNDLPFSSDMLTHYKILEAPEETASQSEHP